jgi:hypothetical protein
VNQLFEVGTADQTVLLTANDPKNVKNRSYLCNSNEELYSSRKTKILQTYSKLAGT